MGLLVTNRNALKCLIGFRTQTVLESNCFITRYHALGRYYPLTLP